MRRQLIIILAILSIVLSANAQTDTLWQFKRQSRRYISIPFRLVNNLIIIKLQINDSKPLNFILDSGIKSTLITEIAFGDSITLNKAETVYLQGLGGGERIEALRTKENTVRLKGLQGSKQSITVLMDNIFQLSEKLGMPINGLIGYELFKNFVVEINYLTGMLKLYKSGDYKKFSKKFVHYPIYWHRFKPYLNIEAKLDANVDSLSPMHVLIDTGSSDALWVFRESYRNLKIPEKQIYSYLGRGLSGDIYGIKARIPYILLGNKQLKAPVVAFPNADELSIAMHYRKRNGSIGGEILKRYKIVFDYPHSRISFKPNHTAKRPFYFNMSGIELSTPYPGLSVFLVVDVRKNSPADKAGMQIGDQILDINNKYAKDYTLEQIQHLFYRGRNKKLSIRIHRKNEFKHIKFVLEPAL